MLGAYADSDDEEGEASEKSVRSADANGNNSADIDSTLANFLAVSKTPIFLRYIWGLRGELAATTCVMQLWIRELPTL